MKLFQVIPGAVSDSIKCCSVGSFGTYNFLAYSCGSNTFILDSLFHCLQSIDENGCSVLSVSCSRFSGKIIIIDSQFVSIYAPYSENLEIPTWVTIMKFANIHKFASSFWNIDGITMLLYGTVIYLYRLAITFIDCENYITTNNFDEEFSTESPHDLVCAVKRTDNDLERIYLKSDQDLIFDELNSNIFKDAPFFIGESNNSESESDNLSNNNDYLIKWYKCDFHYLEMYCDTPKESIIKCCFDPSGSIIACLYKNSDDVYLFYEPETKYSESDPKTFVLSNIVLNHPHTILSMSWREQSVIFCLDILPTLLTSEETGIYRIWSSVVYTDFYENADYESEMYFRNSKYKSSSRLCGHEGHLNINYKNLNYCVVGVLNISTFMAQEISNTIDFDKNEKNDIVVHWMNNKALELSSSLMQFKSKMSSLKFSDIFLYSEAYIEDKLGRRNYLRLLDNWTCGIDCFISFRKSDGSIIVWFVYNLDRSHNMGLSSSSNIVCAIIIPHAIPYAICQTIQAASMTTMIETATFNQNNNHWKYNIVTKHNDASINCWRLRVEKHCVHKTYDFHSISHFKQICGHSFPPILANCHPNLPYIITLSRKNDSTSTRLESSLISPNSTLNCKIYSELIIWHIDTFQSFKKVKEMKHMLKLQQNQNDEILTVEWFPVILPCFILDKDDVQANNLLFATISNYGKLNVFLITLKPLEKFKHKNFNLNYNPNIFVNSCFKYSNVVKIFTFTFTNVQSIDCVNFIISKTKESTQNGIKTFEFILNVTININEIQTMFLQKCSLMYRTNRSQKIECFNQKIPGLFMEFSEFVTKCESCPKPCIFAYHSPSTFYIPYLPNFFDFCLYNPQSLIVQFFKYLTPELDLKLINTINVEENILHLKLANCKLLVTISKNLNCSFFHITIYKHIYDKNVNSQWIINDLIELKEEMKMHPSNNFNYVQSKIAIDWFNDVYGENILIVYINNKILLFSQYSDKDSVDDDHYLQKDVYTNIFNSTQKIDSNCIKIDENPMLIKYRRGIFSSKTYNSLMSCTLSNHLVETKEPVSALFVVTSKYNLWKLLQEEKLPDHNLFKFLNSQKSKCNFDGTKKFTCIVNGNVLIVNEKNEILLYYSFQSKLNLQKYKIYRSIDYPNNTLAKYKMVHLSQIHPTYLLLLLKLNLTNSFKTIMAQFQIFIQNGSELNPTSIFTIFSDLAGQLHFSGEIVNFEDKFEEFIKISHLFNQHESSLFKSIQSHCLGPGLKGLNGNGVFPILMSSFLLDIYDKRLDLVDFNCFSNSLLCWQYLYSSEDEILQQFPQINDKNITWEHLKHLGVGFWSTNLEYIKKIILVIARNEFKKNNNPMDSALFYILLKKKNTLAALYRSQKKDIMAKFFSSDFENHDCKRKALKNAYAMLGRQNFYYSVAFFLVSNRIKDAIKVCIDNLYDINLALIISRLYPCSDFDQNGLIVTCLDDWTKFNKMNLQNKQKFKNQNNSKLVDIFLPLMCFWVQNQYVLSLEYLFECILIKYDDKYWQSIFMYNTSNSNEIKNDNYIFGNLYNCCVYELVEIMTLYLHVKKLINKKPKCTTKFFVTGSQDSTTCCENFVYLERKFLILISQVFDRINQPHYSLLLLMNCEFDVKQNFVEDNYNSFIYYNIHNSLINTVTSELVNFDCLNYSNNDKSSLIECNIKFQDWLVSVFDVFTKFFSYINLFTDMEKEPNFHNQMCQVFCGYESKNCKSLNDYKFDADVNSHCFGILQYFLNFLVFNQLNLKFSNLINIRVAIMHQMYSILNSCVDSECSGSSPSVLNVNVTFFAISCYDSLSTEFSFLSFVDSLSDMSFRQIRIEILSFLTNYKLDCVNYRSDDEIFNFELTFCLNSAISQLLVNLPCDPNHRFNFLESIYASQTTQFNRDIIDEDLKRLQSKMHRKEISRLNSFQSGSQEYSSKFEKLFIENSFNVYFLLNINDIFQNKPECTNVEKLNIIKHIDKNYPIFLPNIFNMSVYFFNLFLSIHFPLIIQAIKIRNCWLLCQLIFKSISYQAFIQVFGNFKLVNDETFKSISNPISHFAIQLEDGSNLHLIYIPSEKSILSYLMDKPIICINDLMTLLNSYDDDGVFQDEYQGYCWNLLVYVISKHFFTVYNQFIIDSNFSHNELKQLLSQLNYILTCVRQAMNELVHNLDQSEVDLEKTNLNVYKQENKLSWDQLLQVVEKDEYNPFSSLKSSYDKMSKYELWKIIIGKKEFKNDILRYLIKNDVMSKIDTLDLFSDLEPEKSESKVKLIVQNKDEITSFCINDNFFKYISYSTNKKIVELDISNFCIYPDNNFDQPIFAARKKHVYLMKDVSSTKLIRQIKGIVNLVHHPIMPSYYLSGSKNGSVTYWHQGEYKEISSVQNSGALNRISSMKFFRDGNTMALSDVDGLVFVYKCLTNCGIFKKTFSLKLNTCNDLCFVGSSSIIAFAGQYHDSKNVSLYDILQCSNTSKIMDLNAGSSACVCIKSIDETNEIYCGTENGQFSIFDIRNTRNCLHLSDAFHGNPVSCMEFEYFKEYALIGSSSGTLKIMDLNTYNYIKTIENLHNKSTFFFKKQNTGILNIHIDRHNNLMSAGADGSIKYIELQSLFNK
ncbi:hypothetical protein A3Q56_00017 [Intoshia linei]|uniref:RAVE complex protein Rav1 C-terminal domain-containing protein n=1 Tax=Intoshia linei TaxID=1819745 RepID=A0A177BF48_9BILA|nr:hypothetical protein A3Q56_00017 [Intoshia linei]